MYYVETRSRSLRDRHIVLTYSDIKSICKVKLSGDLESDGDLGVQLRAHNSDSRYLITISE